LFSNFFILIFFICFDKSKFRLIDAVKNEEKQEIQVKYFTFLVFQIVFEVLYHSSIKIDIG